MDIDLEIDYNEVPEVDSGELELNHFFGDTEEYLFIEVESEEERGLYVADVEGGISELEYSDRERFGARGATAWNLEENEYGVEALVNPGPDEALGPDDSSQGKKPEMHTEDPVENSPLNEKMRREIGKELNELEDSFAAWFSGRRGLEEGDEGYGVTYFSCGEEV